MAWKYFSRRSNKLDGYRVGATPQQDCEIVAALEALEQRLLLTVTPDAVPDLMSINPDTTEFNILLDFAPDAALETFPDPAFVGTAWPDPYPSLGQIELFSRSSSDDPQPHEIALIERTHALVAEDFAPFPVNIVTKWDFEAADPFEDPLNMRIFIGGNGEWYDESGTARSATHGEWDTDEDGDGAVLNAIAFVFSDNLGVFEDAIGNEVSKVIGQTLGLRPQHLWQGNNDLGPNPGFNTPDNQFVGPLMGEPTHGVTVWYNGATDEGPSDFADNIAEIEAFLGARDQIGDNIGGAFDFELSANDTMFDQPAGIISNGDKDFYLIASAGGLLTADLTVPDHFNGDFVLTLWNEAEEELMRVDRVGFPDASLEYLIAEEDAGNYYLSVESTGEYGRIGQYFLSGNTDTPIPDEPPPKGSVTGTIWKDANLNETIDPTDPFFEGVRVYLDVDRDGKFSRQFDPSAITDANGVYVIDQVRLGTYTVGVDRPTGYAMSTALPETYTVVVEDENAVEDIDFALRHRKLQAEYFDVNGNPVMIKLIGKGNMNIKFADPNNPVEVERIRINDSDRRSRLMIKVGGKKDAETTIKDIEVNGALNKLYAPNVDISDDLDVTEGARKIMIDDISGPSARIDLGQHHTRQSTKIIADQILGARLDSIAPFKMIKATEIKSGDGGTPTIIKSTYVGKVITTGDKSRNIAGDLFADFEVRTPGGFDFRQAVGTIKANGLFDFSDLDIIGGVKKIQAEAIGGNINAVIDGILRVLRSRTNLAGSFTADNILRIDSETQVGVNINLTDPQ